MNNVVKLVCLGAVMATSTISISANAGVIGVFGASTGNAVSIASAQGHTIEVISDFSNLGIYDVVWGLNGRNDAHSSQLSTYSAGIESYVMHGGVLMYHDRFVTSGENFIPGASNFSFTRNTSSNIDLAQASGVAGSSINDLTLDGGSSSNHGYVLESSIDQAYTAIFDNGVDGQLVDFSYEYGLGDVYYSSIPLDYYLGGANPVSFSTLYTPQVVDYSISLAQANNGFSPATVSEPESIAIFALSLLGLGARRFKKRV
ncbi:PEP-CTERM sorting domain-containing protein [Alginatibacterium sediminis]|uniref:PEP-CTERM sorting domain-containing protein n=1 Tax=Alginatibacterium sediminis TaxID=2164068 RepID=A0A420E9S5_9ALTE|nr:PEP-CTERM sorting domain-containing protein [Alginatibacterium sediminis]RKF17420.1 PEP-CTERM sorting domain-containing protein [Alginatibacterium sediminis]